MATEVKSAEEFCAWLRGFLDMFMLVDLDRFYPDLESDSTANYLNPLQIAEIRRQLNAVFQYEIDPSLGPPEHQERLQQAHEGELARLREEVRRAQESAYAHYNDRDTIYKC